ncbi:MAG: O-antigen ligase family protein [Xanthobacteraceae bacterium]
MSAISHTVGAAQAPRLFRSVERLRGALLWLTGFAGAIVFMEPSPYEVASLLTIIVFAMTGLALRPALMPLIVMLLLYNTGFSLAVIQVIDQPKALTWVAVSWYLSATAIFFAAMLGTNTRERLSLLMRGTIAAAAVSSIIAILSYFHLLGPISDLFLMYGRAHAAFNDPNVLGAFLILPAMLALQRVLNGRLADATRASLLLGLIAIAVLLTFSRAAWGQFALTAALVLFFTFVTSRSPNERMRIVLIAVAGLVVLALVLMALLSTERVADLFKERASLDQSYDVGPLGRFGRYILGAELALDRPFGIGPLQFHKSFVEDPHNTYLNAFLSGGWLSGFVYLTMVATTVLLGFRHIFLRVPWQATYIAVYCAFIGTVVESAIIDSDHWRHYFLLIGVIWGLMAVSRSARRVSALQPSTLAPAHRAA